MNVVQIASGDLWAGAEAQLYYLSMQLHRRDNLSLYVVLFNHGELEARLRARGVDVWVYDERRLSSVQILLRLVSLFRRLNPDVVHTHRRKENVLGALACLFVRGTGTHSIRTMHGAEEFTAQWWQMHKLLPRLLDWLTGRYLQDKIVAVSDELGELVKQRFSEGKTAVIENGIDIDELFSRSDEPVDLPGPVDAIRVAFVGRLAPVKRPDMFLRVARVLAQEVPNDFCFYMFGDGPLSGDVRTLCVNWGLDDQVFMMGFKSNIHAYLSKMDVLLITSDHEGLPMNLLESLCLGVPVISHAVGAIPKVLANGLYGALVSRQDANEYAERIRGYLSNPDQIVEMVRRGRMMAETRFSATANATAYYDLYTRL